MKDVISILQSRIAKRENEITTAEESPCYCPLCRADGAYAEQREEVNYLAKQQREDKRILAEIVKLRRKTRRLSAEEQFDIVFDKRFEDLVAGVVRSNFVEVTEDGEKPLDEEMVCAILKARWGE